MRQPTLLLTLIATVLTLTGLAAQGDGTIFLRNASFEDMPRHSSTPTGWTDCGFPGESPPDIHPDPTLEFEVRKPPQDGNTYLGLVVRDVDTWERVGQRLSAPLVGGQCYEFRIQLARSELYRSQSRRTRRPENYVTPVKLRVRAGNSICDPGQIIGESSLVSNYDWREFRLKLQPDADYSHLILEAFYETPILIPYNGNVLVDNASPLVPIDCATEAPLAAEPPLAAAEPAEPPRNPEQDIELTPIRPRRVPPPSPAPETALTGKGAEPPKPVVRLGRTEAAIEEGQVFAVEDITFVANSAELEEESEAALQEIVGFLRQNENVVVEIGGHASYKASPQFANEISERRAREVVTYLREHSIGHERMLPKGYGKSHPVCMEDSRDCNQRNQRVEVKILKLRSK